jgi:prepilin-type processing-associated H-X9-DG protein
MSCNSAEFPPPVYPLPQLLYEPQQPGTLHRAGASAEGCTISFADGHAVFWQYASPNVAQEWAQRPVGNAPPDVLQLAAWSSGSVPPGVIP